MDNSFDNSKPSPGAKPDDRITFRRSHLYSLLIPLAFVTGLSVGYLFWGRGAVDSSASANAETQPTTAAAQAGQVQTTRYDVPVDDDPYLGKADAPITIIEFSDYECPYCRRWHNEVLKPLLEAYPDQIRFVYRDFPLSSIHNNAKNAAESANCAGDQGKYWDFSDLLFSTEGSLSSDLYVQYAQSLGLDMDKFQECLDIRKYESEVQADYDYAANLGVNSTPTFFINGIALVGAQPLDVFQSLIDKELAGELN